MASLSVRRLDEETMCRLRMRAARQNVSVEEAVRRILRVAVADEEPIGTMIRRLVADNACDLELPEREVDEPIDFTSTDYDFDERS